MSESPTATRSPGDFLLCCFFILLVSFVRYETCLLVVFNFSDCLLLTIDDGWLAKPVHSRGGACPRPGGPCPRPGGLLGTSNCTIERGSVHVYSGYQRSLS